MQNCLAPFNLKWWHLVCVIYRVHSKGLLSSSFLPCSGRHAWPTWTMSLFLDGTLRNTWGSSEKSSNNFARQGFSWNLQSVFCYCHKYPILVMRSPPKGCLAIHTRVEQWPIPAKVSDVRSFLGLALYYHRYIADFVEITVPLHQVAGVVSPVPLQDWTLIRKEAPECWCPVQESPPCCWGSRPDSPDQCKR